MSKSLQAIRGMNDILPAQTDLALSGKHLRATADSYGYSGFACLSWSSPTSSLAASVKAPTWSTRRCTFLDRNEESLTLRLGTAGCVRAVLEHGMTGGGQVQKLWYTGPMFR